MMRTTHKFSALAAALLLSGVTAFAQYCTPVYTTGTSDNDRIDGVELGTISNTGSGGEISGTGYSDYTYLSTDLTNGAEYTLTVTNGPSWSTTITAWIDFNQDEIFSVDEVLGNLSMGAGGVGNIIFTTPVTALAGETRMRVRGIYPSGLATPLDPCASATYGEAEDYTVVMSGPLANNLTVTGIPAPVSGADLGTVSVTVSLWNSGAGDATDFTVNYNVDGGAVVSEAYAGTLAAGDMVDYTFATDYTFADYGCAAFSAWIEWADDEFDGDNSYDKTVCNAGPVTGTGAWYVNSNSTGGEPWGSSSNLNAMDAVFGGAWTHGYFETLDPFEVFGSDNCFVFLEGSDAHANELETFLTANITTIESWVAAGGRLLLNAAPNEGDGMNFGFDGTNLVYSYYTGTATAVDLSHPIFVGPFTPVGDTWTGSSFGHARITGTDLNNLIVDAFATSNVVLAEKYYGAGIVLFGGMTTNNFHSPATEAANLRANIISYLSCDAAAICPVPGAPSVEIVSSTYASVSWDPVDGVERYVFAIRDNTTGEKWTRQTTDTFMELTALTAGHSYTVRLRSVCYPDDISDPGAQTDFTMPLRMGDAANSLTIYPNPSNGQFNLLLNGYDEGQVMVNITNTMGQVIYTASITSDGANTVQEINLGNIASGTYFIQLTNGNRMDMQTIVIE